MTHPPGHTEETAMHPTISYYLALDPDVNPGYDRVDVHIEATSPAADADLHAAITDAVRHSPNFNNFRRAISVTPTITTGTDR